jgi:hypothetical protein
LFGCTHDADKQVAQLHKKYRYHRIQYMIEAVEKYECRGRPNPLTPKGLYPSPLKVLEIIFEMDYKYGYEVSADQ